MADYLVFDFETVDPYIDRKLGSGWVYGLNVPTSDFEVLGCSMFNDVLCKTEYHTDPWLPAYKNEAKGTEHINWTLIAHNAQYDLGCATYLGWPVKDMPVYDTEVMSRLYDSSLSSHSLDALGEKYLGIKKDHTVLIDAIKEHDLYPYFEYEYKKKTRTVGRSFIRVDGETTLLDSDGTPFPPDAEVTELGDNKVKVVTKTKIVPRDWSKHTEASLLSWAKKNMKVIQTVAPKAMAAYANRDVEITWKLFNFFKEKMNEEQMARALKFSMLSHICIDYRKRGVPLDLDAIRKAQKEIGPLIETQKEAIYAEAGRGFNIASSQEKGEILKKRGLDVPFQTKAPDRYSVDAKWLGRQDDKLCAMLLEYNKYNKIKRDTFDKLLEIQTYTVGPDAYKGNRGRLYPELNLLRARTGRFSSQGPNIQNIPKRHKVLGPMCRGFFVPEEGETFYSLDYSNQEGRLQLHYAYLLDCKGAEQLVNEFNKDPRFDLHQLVADMCKLDREDGKQTNHAISYGMGMNTQAQNMNTTRARVKEIRKKYNNEFPYLKELSDKCQEVLLKRGYIKTIGGRMLALDPGYEYKALNMLIQGSASDQTIAAMELAYERGLPVLFPVHDELCMSSSNPQDAYDLQALMVNAVELVVPTVVDIGKGASWRDCK